MLNHLKNIFSGNFRKKDSLPVKKVTPEISPELLKEIKSIQIRTNYLVNDVMTGEYETAFKGRGMEFAEVREYQPGDDIRSIDWNVTARMGLPLSRNIRKKES